MIQERERGIKTHRQYTVSVYACVYNLPIIWKSANAFKIDFIGSSWGVSGVRGESLACSWDWAVVTVVVRSVAKEKMDEEKLETAGAKVKVWEASPSSSSTKGNNFCLISFNGLWFSSTFPPSEDWLNEGGIRLLVSLPWVIPLIGRLLEPLDLRLPSLFSPTLLAEKQRKLNNWGDETLLEIEGDRVATENPTWTETSGKWWEKSNGEPSCEVRQEDSASPTEEFST